MTIYAYIRVSTDKQILDSQRLELSSKYKIDEWVEDVYTGTKSDRPGFLALRGKLKKGDRLIVTKLDRLGRNTIELLQFLQELEDLEVSVIISNLGIDTGTPSGKLVLRVLAAVAEFERDVTVERVKSGLRAAKARGVSLGAKCKLSENQRKEALELKSEGKLSQAEIAAKYGVDRSTISKLACSA